MNLKEVFKIALAAGLIAMGIHQFAQAADAPAPATHSSSLSQ